MKRIPWELRQVLLILLLAVSLVALWKKAGSGEASEIDAEVQTDSDTCVTDINVSTVAGEVLKNAGGSVALIIQDGEIDFVGTETIDADSTVVKSFLYATAHLSAAKNLGRLEPVEDFGFDAPVAQITFVLKDGSQVKYYLGDPTPLGDGYYLRTEDDIVYVISNTIGELLLYSLDDFRRDEVLPHIDDDTTIDAIAISTGDSLQSLTRVERNHTSIYCATKPFESILDTATVKDTLITPIRNLKRSGFVSVGIDPYAFYSSCDSENVSVLCLKAGDETYNLFFYPASDGEYYAVNLESDQLITVSAESLSFLGTDFSDLIGSTLYSIAAADTESVSISAEGLSGTLQVYGEGESLCSEFEGKSFDNEVTGQIFRKLTMIPPAREIDSEETVSGDVLLSLTFERRDGGEDTVTLVAVDDRKCAVILNGQADWITYTSTVNEMIRSLITLLSK